MFFPQPLFAPEGADGGVAAPTAPEAATAPTPSSGSPAPESSSPTGGLKDAAQETGNEFTIPDLTSLDDLEEIVVPATREPPQPTPPVEAAPKPDAPVPPQPQAEAPKAPEQQQQTGQQQTQPQEAAPPTEAEPASLAQMLQTHRDALISEMATKHFALSPQEVEALQDDAVTAVPKLLAKVHLDAVSTALNHMATLVPKMIEAHARVTEANNKAKNSFFDAWPALKGKEAEVARMAGIYRQMNPQAKLDDVIRDVGPIVMSQLKMSPQPMTNGSTASQPKPAAFTPAVGGVAAIPSSPPAPDPWSGLGMDFD